MNIKFPPKCSENPPVQWILGVGGGGGLSLGIKLSGRETGHSPPSVAQAKDKKSYTSIHPHARLRIKGATPPFTHMPG